MLFIGEYHQNPNIIFSSTEIGVSYFAIHCFMIMNYLRNEHKKVRVRTVRFTKSGSLSLLEKSLELKSFGRGVGFNVGTCTFESQTR